MAQSDERSVATAVLVGLAAAIAGYIPSAMAWGTARRWLTPITIGEDVMGRGLEAIFIGGPVGGLLLGALAGCLTYRAGSRVTTGAAVAVLLAVAAVALTAARVLQLM